MNSREFLIVSLGSILFALSLFAIFPQKTSTKILSPLSGNSNQGNTPIIRGGSLKEVVEKSLLGTKGKYGIVIKNLKNGDAYLKNENEKFEPASLYKLWVLGTAFKLIKEGKLSKTEVLARDVKELNEMFQIDEEETGQTEGTIQMTTSEAIDRMITASHNYAALLLVSRIRNSTISAFMKEQNFKDSRLGSPPQTSARDMALFFEKLYSGSMVDGNRSKEMLELLIRQELNDRIPKYLPKGIEVAHKTGEIGGFKHDAGIVFAKDPILIVILSESNSPKGAAERIAELSRNIYGYFEDK